MLSEAEMLPRSVIATVLKPNCSFSWFTRSDKIKIALESYDALIANIHSESLDFPLHQQGRLGDILSGIKFDLKNACPAVIFK